MGVVVDVGTASSASAVSQAEAAGTGYWTEWINVDTRVMQGTGEFEDCSRIAYEQDLDRKCYLGCEAPLAARYSLADEQTTASWTDIGMSTARRPTLRAVLWLVNKLYK